MKNLIGLVAMISAGLVCGASAQEKNQPGEMVALRALSANVQQTIRQQAAGGQIVAVKREDDMNGKWNYEVTVKSNGKEWGFEVAPNGQLVRKHGGMQH